MDKKRLKQYEANLLERVDVNLRGAAEATPFIKNVDYNAKGQRTMTRAVHPDTAGQVICDGIAVPERRPADRIVARAEADEYTVSSVASRGYECTAADPVAFDRVGHRVGVEEDACPGVPGDHVPRRSGRAADRV